MFPFSKRGRRAQDGASRDITTSIAANPGRSELMTARAESYGSVSLVTVIGEIDESTANQFAARVHEQMQNCRMVIVDMTRVTFLGVAGHHALASVNARRSETGADWIAVPSPAVRRALQLINTGEQIPTAVTVAEAWAASGQSPRE